MKLKYLEYFLTVAELGNITHAAQQLYLSQPNLTVAMKRLEEELGVTLLKRNNKSVTLTDDGQFLYDRLRPLVTNLHAALDEVKDRGHKKGGILKIGIPPMIGSFMIKPLLSHFSNAHPNWELNIVEDGSIGLQNKLVNGDLDLAIIIADTLPKGLNAKPIMNVEYKACIPITHPLIKKDSISFTELESESLIMMQLDSFHRQYISKQLELHHITPRIAMSSNHVNRNLDMTVQTNSISFLLTPSPIERNDIKLISMNPPILASVAVVYANKAEQNKTIQALIEYLCNI